MIVRRIRDFSREREELSELRNISLIICTHNRREILLQTLQSLRELQAVPGTAVELVVVANACTDGTEQMVREQAATMPFPTRCIVEPRANLAIARNCGMRNTTSPICIMLDDDVWVEKYWLAGMLEVFDAHSEGIVVGKVTCWWHSTPKPPWMRPSMEGLLSVADFGEKVIEVEPGSALGCNYMFSRKLWEEIGGFAEGMGRTGKSLIGGEDVRFSQEAIDRGHRIFYAPRGELRHFVAPFKATEEYLTKVAYGNAKSKIFAKEPFGPKQVARSFLGHLYLYLWNGARELIAAIRGDYPLRLERRVQKCTGAGGLSGIGRRLAGLQLR